MRLSPLPPRAAAPVIIPQESPVYRLKAPFFGPDDHLYAEGEILIYEDEPNPEMEPMNELAQDAMRTYLKKLDEHGKTAAEKVGRGYTGLSDAYENSLLLSKQQGKRVQSLSKREAAPMMRAKKDVKGIARIELKEAGPEVQAVASRKRGIAKESTPAAVNGNVDLLD